MALHSPYRTTFVRTALKHLFSSRTLRTFCEFNSRTRRRVHQHFPSGFPSSSSCEFEFVRFAEVEFGPFFSSKLNSRTHIAPCTGGCRPVRFTCRRSQGLYIAQLGTGISNKAGWPVWTEEAFKKRNATPNPDKACRQGACAHHDSTTATSFQHRWLLAALRMIQRQKWPPAATMLDAEHGGDNRRSLLALSTAQGEWRKARLTLLGARGERRQRRLRALQRAPNAARRLARVEATHALQASRDRLTGSLGRWKQAERERERAGGTGERRARRAIVMECKNAIGRWQGRAPRPIVRQPRAPPAPRRFLSLCCPGIEAQSTTLRR